MISFDKIVKKMLRKGGKIYFKNDIYEFVDPELKPEYTTVVNKIIYKLKSQKFIITLKNGVYLVPDQEDLELNEIDLLEKYYFQLLKKYIILNCRNEYFISGNKALEINNKNLGVPERIFIVNRSVEKKVFIGSYVIIFKKVTGNIDGKKVNMYSKLSKFVNKKELFGYNFKVSCLELSLVESCIISDSQEGIDISLITKTIKKYHKAFDREKFYDIGKLKFIMSFNRLKELSKNIDRELYLVFLDIIKQNGGLFIGEGLRQI